MRRTCSGEGSHFIGMTCVAGEEMVKLYDDIRLVDGGVRECRSDVCRSQSPSWWNYESGHESIGGIFTCVRECFFKIDPRLLQIPSYHTLCFVLPPPTSFLRLASDPQHRNRFVGRQAIADEHEQDYHVAKADDFLILHKGR